jgi:hypothetical protein
MQCSYWTCTAFLDLVHNALMVYNHTCSMYNRPSIESTLELTVYRIHSHSDTPTRPHPLTPSPQYYADIVIPRYFDPPMPLRPRSLRSACININLPQSLSSLITRFTRRYTPTHQLLSSILLTPFSDLPIYSSSYPSHLQIHQTPLLDYLEPI